MTRELTDEEDQRIVCAVELALEHISGFDSAADHARPEEAVAFYRALADACTALADTIEREQEEVCSCQMT